MQTNHLSETNQNQTKSNMKTKTILSLITILGLAASASAEVLIYRGVDRVTVDLSSQSPKVINQYLVVDYTARQVGLIYFYANKTGKFYVPGAAGTVHMSSTALAAGHTASLISAGSSYDNSPTDYSESLAFFRGTNTTVTIATTPILVQRNLPRGLSGTGTSTGSPGYFRNEAFGFTLDAKRTITANNSNRTIDQAISDIEAELKAKGYAQ